MKIAFAVVLGIVLILVAVRVVSFFNEERALNQNLSDIQSRLTDAKSQEANLQGEMQYLANPANLEKELRTQFNYKKPGENMVIIVPPPSQASTTP
jgi:cell division protein FtsL